MTRARSWLAALLALQLAVAAILAWHQGSSSRAAPEQALLDLEVDDIERIVIDSGDNTVTLERQGEQWRLPALDNLPAISRAGPLLEQLAGLRGGWPVATSPGSHERFGVAAEHFDKRLRLYRGDTLAGELYVGNSAGLRRSYVRAAGDEAVHSVSLNTYDIHTTSRDWLDKALLAVDDASAIRGADFRIERDGDHWRLAGDEPTDPNAPAAPAAGEPGELAGALASLRVQDVAIPPKGTPPEATLAVEGPAGNYSYRFWREGDDRYLVQRDDIDSAFTLSQYQYERLADIRRAALAGETGEGEDVEEDSPGDEPEPAVAGDDAATGERDAD